MGESVGNNECGKIAVEASASYISKDDYTKLFERMAGSGLKLVNRSFTQDGMRKDGVDFVTFELGHKPYTTVYLAKSRKSGLYSYSLREDMTYIKLTSIGDDKPKEEKEKTKIIGVTADKLPGWEENDILKTIRSEKDISTPLLRAAYYTLEAQQKSLERWQKEQEELTSRGKTGSDWQKANTTTTAAELGLLPNTEIKTVRLEAGKWKLIGIHSNCKVNDGINHVPLA